MKNHGKLLKNIFAVAVAAALSMGALCGSPVPSKEMSLARLEISRALTVKADKYAPQEMEAAKNALLESHTMVKDDKLDKAKESAELARKKAKEAYDKSLPLLAKDTMDIAEKSINDADEANAAVLAKEDFEGAKDAFKTAGEKFEGKQYYECYTSAVEADKLAKSARNTSMGKKSLLKDAIDEVKITLQDARGYNAAANAPDKLKAAEENLAVAEEALGKDELKKGFAAVETAKMNADEAYLESIKKASGENIAEAELLIEKAARSEGALIAKEELEGAKEALAGAKGYQAESKYRESLTSSGEAKRLASLVLATKKSAGRGEGDGDITDDKTGTAEGAVEYKTYRVKYNPGNRDCLWKIAGRYYNNPRLWKRIYEANRDKIKNPDLIHPGIQLRIPIIKK
ncbi:MAG TPA: DUF4398 domain-containing protein [Spirochaetes bacterium]|nr:DUF4398 domain-containing protein [Spirochaetota bacterium]